MSNPFAYLDVVSIRMFELTSDTVDVVPILLELAISISIAMNPSYWPCLRGGPTLEKNPFLKPLTSASWSGEG